MRPSIHAVGAMIDRTASAGTERLVIALTGCSLSVTADVRAKSCRPLALTGDIFMKSSLWHRGVRASESTCGIARHEHRRRSVRPSMHRITGHYPPIWAATWIARVTVVTAPERLFGSRPGAKSLG
jgi:hypothetical protein